MKENEHFAKVGMFVDVQKLLSFKDYRLFCVVQCSLTFVADEPGANRKLHRDQSLTVILTTMMMVIWYDAVQNVDDDVDDEKNGTDKIFKVNQYEMKQTKNNGKK